MKEKTRTIVYTVSASLLLIAVIGLMIAHLSWMAWVMLIGGLGYSSAHLSLVSSTPSASTRVKRLTRLAIIAGFFWVAAAVCRLNNVDVWAILIIVAVVFMAYSNISLTIMHNNTKQEQ